MSDQIVEHLLITGLIGNLEKNKNLCFPEVNPSLWIQWDQTIVTHSHYQKQENHNQKYLSSNKKEGLTDSTKSVLMHHVDAQ